MAFSVYTIYAIISKRWRARRFDLFCQLLRPAPSDILLDVGGHPQFWTAHPQPVARIDTLNLHEVEWFPDTAPKHHIRTLIADGCSMDIKAQSYDIGYSNSVIEHVCTWERQQQFASEIRRVAKALWVQTPAYECPVEPHYLTPFIHYLPRPIRRRVLRWGTVWGWIARPDQDEIDAMIDGLRLLRKSEMQQLFPDCEIITERMLWVIPKSYIAIRRLSPESQGARQ